MIALSLVCDLNVPENEYSILSEITVSEFLNEFPLFVWSSVQSVHNLQVLAYESVNNKITWDMCGWFKVPEGITEKIIKAMKASSDKPQNNQFNLIGNMTRLLAQDNRDFPCMY